MAGTSLTDSAFLFRANTIGKCNCLSSNALRQRDCHLLSQNKRPRHRAQKSNLFGSNKSVLDRAPWICQGKRNAIFLAQAIRASGFPEGRITFLWATAAGGGTHSYAIKNQPGSLSLFVLGGRGGHSLQAHYLLRGMGAVCSAQAKRSWQMQLFEHKCLKAKRLQFVEPKQASPAPYAKEQFVWLQQIAFGHAPSFVNARE